MLHALSPLLRELVQSLQRLPGVGPKSAQRMAFFLLGRDPETADKLWHSLKNALENIQRCSQCQNFTEFTTCEMCLNSKRDPTLLCILESPTDLLAFEQTAAYRGLYFILNGHLSPLDGISPEDIGIPKLCDRLAQGQIQEMILATHPTIEGEATAHYISDIARQYTVKTTRIAYGVPIGGDLGHIDPGTLARALERRTDF